VIDYRTDAVALESASSLRSSRKDQYENASLSGSPTYPDIVQAAYIK